ncbi:MAG: hypothetical protein ACF8XB_23755, partial [Planctomycetota bacterium JB042]
MREARRSGRITAEDLDVLLTCERATLAFEACLRRLLGRLAEVELDLPAGAPRSDAPFAFDA